MPRRVLILFAHPVLERSRVNRRLLAAVDGLDGVTVQDLYETYPTMAIDVAREQALLLEHDVFIFQHPFYWYSTPAILKEWQDLVLEHGWAYGSGGTRLHGKIMFNALTTGGPASAFQRGGDNRFTVRELLAPWEQTASFCGMRYLAPFVVHAALGFSQEADIVPHRDSYLRLVEALRDDRIDLERAALVDTINGDLDALMTAREVA